MVSNDGTRAPSLAIKLNVGALIFGASREGVSSISNSSRPAGSALRRFYGHVAEADLQGYLHGVLLFTTSNRCLSASRASLDLVDDVVHTENIPGVPLSGIARRRRLD